MVQLATEIEEFEQEISPFEKRPSGTRANFNHEEDNSDARLGTASAGHVYLHEPRMKDDLEEYRERMAGSD